MGNKEVLIFNRRKRKHPVVKKAVFDAGPFIHLNEINKVDLLGLFQKILTTKEVLNECRKIILLLRSLNFIEEKELTGKSKDLAKYLLEKYNLDLGEATVIALCSQELVQLFFTDDLEARNVAKNLGFEPHGTIAIILRSLKERRLDKSEAKELVEKLYSNSSLFLSRDLKEWIINEINRFR